MFHDTADSLFYALTLTGQFGKKKFFFCKMTKFQLSHAYTLSGNDNNNNSSLSRKHSP